MRPAPFLKHLALLVTLFLTVGAAQAQEGLFFRLGYNQTYAQLDSLNYIIGRYNDTRSWLTKEMQEIHTPAGIAIQAGYAGQKWVTEFAFVGRWQRVKAQGDQNGNIESRFVRYGASTFEAGIARRLTPFMQLGLSLDIGAIKVRTRTSSSQASSTQVYYDAVRGTTLGNSLYLQFGIPISDILSLDIRPYYHFNWIATDFAPLNQAINPFTYVPDPDFIVSRTSHVGLRIMVSGWIK